jgi:hypothetical protein
MLLMLLMAFALLQQEWLETVEISHIHKHRLTRMPLSIMIDRSLDYVDEGLLSLTFCLVL